MLNFHSAIFWNLFWVLQLSQQRGWEADTGRFLPLRDESYTEVWLAVKLRQGTLRWGLIIFIEVVVWMENATSPASLG